MERLPSFQPAAPGSLQDRIRQSVEADILAGVRLPGSVIDERALAQQFQTSRTPVREALIVLATLGLVAIVPRSGMYVRQASSAELVARFEALQELEALVAGLAARRATAGHCHDMQQALNAASALARSPQGQGYEAANAALHDTIYAACGNPVLVEEVRSLRRSLAAYRARGSGHAGWRQASDAGHQRIVQAICHGDAATATEAMRDHIGLGGEAIVQLVAAAERLHGAARGTDNPAATGTPARRPRRQRRAHTPAPTR